MNLQSLTKLLFNWNLRILRLPGVWFTIELKNSRRHNKQNKTKCNDILAVVSQLWNLHCNIPPVTTSGACLPFCRYSEVGWSKLPLTHNFYIFMIFRMAQTCKQTHQLIFKSFKFFQTKILYYCVEIWYIKV